MKESALVSTNQTSAIGKMRTAGIMFIVVGVISAIIDFIALFLVLDYLEIISTVILAAAILLLGTAMSSFATIFPSIAEQAKKTGGFLMAYVFMDILTAIFLFLVPVLPIITGIVSLILRISGFNYLNTTFRSIDRGMESRMFPLFGWFGVIVVVALLITIFTLSVTLVLVVGIIAIIGGILLLIGIGIKLLNNSKEIANIQKLSHMQPTYKPISQPIQAQQTAPIPAGNVKFCANCGNKIEEGNVKFCANCGASI